MSAPVDEPRRRVVVGVDGSESSIIALNWADRLSSGLGAELDVVLAYQHPTTYAMAIGLTDQDPGADAAHHLLAVTLKGAFGGDPPAGLEATIRQGHPARVLLDASVDATMLVVGSRGRGGFVGLLIGSVSAHCAEHAGCPVLVVHDKG